MRGLLAITCIVLVAAQIPIPNRYDGFTQGTADSPVLFEAFVDLLCPDCAAAWPTIKQVLAHYNVPGQASNLRFVLHTFPLPFHHNAYFAAQGLHVIAMEDMSATWPYVDMMFTYQQNFWNPETADTTPNEVISAMASLTEKAVGFSSQSFIAGLNNDSYDGATRISWKYGCSRTVSGTPTFILNGIILYYATPEWTLSDWMQVIDPLLPNANVQKLGCAQVHHEVFVNPPKCTGNQTLCNFSPGKYQCCLPGENCFPNVGCRC